MTIVSQSGVLAAVVTIRRAVRRAVKVIVAPKEPGLVTGMKNIAAIIVQKGLDLAMVDMARGRSLVLADRAAVLVIVVGAIDVLMIADLNIVDSDLNTTDVIHNSDTAAHAVDSDLGIWDSDIGGRADLGIIALDIAGSMIVAADMDLTDTDRSLVTGDRAADLGRMDSDLLHGTWEIMTLIDRTWVVPGRSSVTHRDTVTRDRLMRITNRIRRSCSRHWMRTRMGSSAKKSS